MDYPEEFSGQARNRIETARIKASRELEQAQSKEPPADWTRTNWDKFAFYDYILRWFSAFGHEACELGKQGIWSADTIRDAAEEFLRRLTIEAYYEKGHDRYGQKLPKMTPGEGLLPGSLLPEVKKAFHGSTAWRQFEDRLQNIAEQTGGEQGMKMPAEQERRGQRSVAESVPSIDEPRSDVNVRETAPAAEWEPAQRKIAPASVIAKNGASTSTPVEVEPSTTWSAIKIKFLSEHRVQSFRDGKAGETLNYAELGFADKRQSGRPNKSWELLLDLAKSDGVYEPKRRTAKDIADVAKGRTDPQPERLGAVVAVGRNNSRIQARMARLRKALQAYFHIQGDPIPWDDAAGCYKACFEINTAPSFKD